MVKKRAKGTTAGVLLAVLIVITLFSAGQQSDQQAVVADAGAVPTPMQAPERVERGDPVATRANMITDLLEWSTFFGGPNDDRVRDLVVDVNGSIYVCGETDGYAVAESIPGYDSYYDGGIDAFVAKFYPNGSTLEYFTYLGGTAEDVAWALDVNASGAVVACGHTDSTDFPTTLGAVNYNERDSFVAKLSPDGTNLEWSRLIGGAGAKEWATDVELDSYDQPHVVGSTNTADLPTTANAQNATNPGGGGDVTGWVARLLPSGELIDNADSCWLSYLGGTGVDKVNGTCVVGNDTIIVGSTFSTDFPTVGGNYSTFAGVEDAFIFRYSLNLGKGTFFGGSNGDWLLDVAYNNDSGSLLVAGGTTSSDMPTSPGAYNETTDGDPSAVDMIIANFSAEFLNMSWSTTISTFKSENAHAVDVHEESGWVYVAGETHYSPAGALNGYPITPGAPWTSGWERAVAVSVLNSTGSGLIYSTVFPSESYDQAFSVAVVNQSTFVVAGKTETDDGTNKGFPVTAGSWQTDIDDGQEGFVSMIEINLTGPFLRTITEAPYRTERTKNFTMSAYAAAAPDLTIEEVWIHFQELGNTSFVQYGESWNWSVSVPLIGATRKTDYDFSLHARDTGGNETAVTGLSLYVGGSPWIRSINYSQELEEDEFLTVVANVTDDISGVSSATLRMNGAEHSMVLATNGWYIGDLAMNDTGEFQFYVLAEDNVGQATTSSNYSFTVVTPERVVVTAPEQEPLTPLSPVVPTFVWYTLVALVTLAVVLLTALHGKIPGLGEQSMVVAGAILAVLAFVMTSYTIASGPLAAEGRSTAWPIGTVAAVNLMILAWAMLAFVLPKIGIPLGGIIIFAILSFLSFAVLTPAALFTTDALFAWAMLAQMISFGAFIAGSRFGTLAFLIGIAFAIAFIGLLGWFTVVEAINWFADPQIIGGATTNLTGGAV